MSFVTRRTDLEEKIDLVDPDGNVHTGVSQRNARDLVNHVGWKYAKPTEEENADAYAPRDVKPREEASPARKRKKKTPEGAGDVDRVKEVQADKAEAKAVAKAEKNKIPESLAPAASRERNPAPALGEAEAKAMAEAEAKAEAEIEALLKNEKSEGNGDA